ncbi:MAG: 50S ribosomal protein L22 [Thermoplasmata archaeon]|nr:MAG: 50S ribosomal protein L22 [Thermoplasmata archaeon]
MVGYTVDIDPETSARAIGRELPISPKHSIVICRHIKGWPLERAKDFLADVIAKKAPVPDTRYGSSGHRRGKVGPGRFPEKAARQILKVLEGAEANAEYKGLVVDDMYIAHSAASRGRAWEGRFPRARGRATPKIRETVNVEIILRESGELED